VKTINHPLTDIVGKNLERLEKIPTYIKKQNSIPFTKTQCKVSRLRSFKMPVQYSSIIAEHKTVRSAVGVFDVSHMGEFISGAIKL
jgi:competence transcription factor ComK